MQRTLRLKTAPQMTATEMTAPLTTATLEARRRSLAAARLQRVSAALARGVSKPWVKR